MTRYIVVGAGAIGATVAAELHRSGTDVLLIARGEQLAALRRDGLRYVRPDGVHTLDLPVAGGPDEVALRADDVLVVATKSQDTEEVLRRWAWLPVGDGAGVAADELPVVLLQNGLANERAALRRFATVVGAMVWLPAGHLAPGEVVARSGRTVGALWLGRYPRGSHPVVPAVAADLRAAGFAVQEVTDVVRWKAAKLLNNLRNAADALYRRSSLRDLAVGALRAEGRAVLAAAGTGVADPRAEGTVDVSGVSAGDVPGYPVGGGSTWQSLARGGEPETDFLNGEITLLARLAGADAPLNLAMQRRVRRAVREGTPAGSLGDDDLGVTLRRAAPVLIGPVELRERLSGPLPPVVLDVRWRLGDPHGRERYRAGHVPGAVYADLDTELSAPPSAAEGRHPLPEVASLQAAARRWGITAGRTVVVYDDLGGQAAARAWWLLRWAGVFDVRLLDGAWPGWLAAGCPAATGEETAVPGDVTLTGGLLPTLTTGEAAALARAGVLLDARAGERYRGEVEPVDPRAGHIPGAVSAPTTGYLDDGGAMLSPDGVRRRLRALGVDLDAPAEVGVYCGSGVTAAHTVAALAAVGVDAALYPGSWSAWCADPQRPVATGPEPG